MDPSTVQTLRDAVGRYRRQILEAERYLWQHPETGYREALSSQYMEDAFTRLGYSVTRAEGIPGFYTVLDTGRTGPELLILSELDSVICPAHPEANPETGAVHACGHHAQGAAILGIAAALTDPAVTAPLSGRVRLCVVPAEELLELEYRSLLKKQGKIRYFTGKSEFLSRGYFDGVDLALMVHVSNANSVTLGAVGCIAKTVTYKGRAAHAGGNPWDGCNALYAATAGLNAVNAIRETFRDSDLIRVHPIVTHGGDMVNAIPSTVRLESYVRGKTAKAIKEENQKVNRALIGGALSLGANIEIDDMAGYAPLINAPDMITLAGDAAALALPEDSFTIHEIYSTGSTDMGDLSAIMPVVHPYVAGAVGTSHGSDYFLTDPDAACVKNAVWQLTMLTLLLENGGERAKQIISDYRPLFASKEAFLAYQASLFDSGERITYKEDKAELRL